MDYNEMVKRIDEMQMNARDRAAAKAQLAHAERFADWTLAAAGGLSVAVTAFADALRLVIAKVRSSVHRIRAA